MSKTPEKLPTPDEKVAESITLDGEVFTFVKVREFIPVSIYKGKNSFLKTGSRDVLEKEFDFQKHLFELGFPVPSMTNMGEVGEIFYFTEESLGEDSFEDLFLRDVDERKEIPDEHFRRLVEIIRKYANSQIKTSAECNNHERFTQSLLRHDLINEEIPDVADKTNEALKKALNALSIFPVVLTHCDFHAANIFPKGIIDFEGFTYAPFGYDLLTNIYAAYIFSSEKSEVKYSFTEEQIRQYLDEIDEICTIHNLPKLSGYRDHFIFLRLIWATVRMHQWPKTQALRYARYKRILDEYIKGSNIEDMLLTS